MFEVSQVKVAGGELWVVVVVLVVLAEVDELVVDEVEADCEVEEEADPLEAVLVVEGVPVKVDCCEELEVERV